MYFPVDQNWDSCSSLSCLYLGAEGRQIIQVPGKDPVHCSLVTWHCGSGVAKSSQIMSCRLKYTHDLFLVLLIFKISLWEHSCIILNMKYLVILFLLTVQFSVLWSSIRIIPYTSFGVSSLWNGEMMKSSWFFWTWLDELIMKRDKSCWYDFSGKDWN